MKDTIAGSASTAPAGENKLILLVFPYIAKSSPRSTVDQRLVLR